MIIVLNVLIYVHRASICEHILSSLPSPRRNVIYWVPFSHTHLLDCNDDTLRPGSRNESKILPCWRVIVLKSFSNLFKLCKKLRQLSIPCVQKLIGNVGAGPLSSDPSLYLEAPNGSNQFAFHVLSFSTRPSITLFHTNSSIFVVMQFFWESVQCFCKKISMKPSLIFCIECPPHFLLHIFMKMHNIHILATKPIILKIHNSAGNDRCNLFHANHSSPHPPFFDLSSSAYLIIVADAADAVSVNFSGRCKFLQI